MTRFLLIYDFLTELGGLEKLMAIHARFLIRAGYEVKLLFGHIDPKSGSNEIFEGLELESYGTLKSGAPLKLIGGIMGANKLKRIIQPEDIIISYSFPVNVTIRNFKNTKILYLNHYPNFLYLPIKERIVWANTLTRKIALAYSFVLGPLTKHFDKKYVKINDLIFINSGFTKAKLDPLYGIEGIVSYPPIRKEFEPTYSADTVHKFRLPEKYVFASGRIIPDKRYDLLLEAFSKIKDQEVNLVLAGKWDDNEYTKLIALAQDLKINDRILFTGFVTTEELLHLYSSALAYVMPTPQEDFGMTTAEALSCGTPIIVWDDGGGSCEQCTDGINGFKAKPYNTTDFARLIDKCIDEAFKERRQTNILESSNKFSERFQEKIFIGHIKRLLGIDPITLYRRRKDDP